MNLLDVVILAILAFYLISGMYRGSITSFLGTAGFVAAWFGARQLYPQVAQLALSNQTLMAVLNQYLEPESFFATHAQAVTTVSEVIAGGETAIQNAIASVSSNLAVVSKAFEANVRSQVFQNLGIDTLADYLDQTIWQAVFNVGAFILCFVALYVLAMLVVNLLDHVISFPLLRGVDWLVGGLLGLARGLVVCALLLFLLPAIAQIVSPQFAADLVNNSTLMKLFDQIKSLDFVKSWMHTLIGG
ncbi:MAG: CvpA family protein [Clostridia bacterium]|nr:CvpA family protein [Clostridia bacterium]